MSPKLPTNISFAISLIWILTTGTTLAQSTEINAQINRTRPRELTGSPNAAALGKFGNYEATSYNGLPSISIPIFEVQSGSLKVPISLNYHAGGIKLNEHASWVGLGWSLSAGGQISRQTNGKRDEDEYAAANTAPLKASVDICQNPTDLSYISDIAYGNLDTRPDTWSYSFPGKSGKFVLRERQVAPPLLIPNEPFKVNFNNAFNISMVDDAGVTYYYGTASDGTNPGSTIGMEGSNNGTDGGMTALYLMDMKGANSNDRISFGYQGIGTVAHNEVSEYVQITENCISTGEGYECPPQSTQNINRTTPTTFTNSIGAEVIHFDAGKVEFIKSATDRNDEDNNYSLDSIKIYSQRDGSYVLDKVFKFYYSYFRNVSNDADLRLKLDQIRAFDALGKAILSYSFSYKKYDNGDSYNRLPWRSWNLDKFSRDYWGYYNGPTGASNQDLMLPVSGTYAYTNPGASTPLSFGTANREPDATYINVGVLDRIDFPTGGYTTFEYEPNKYLKDTTPQLAGGIRVSRIKTFDGVNAPIIKEYKYGSTLEAKESSYGKANFDPSKFQFFNSSVMLKKCCGSGVCGALQAGELRYTSKVWHSTTSYNSLAYGGAAVVYPYVTEYLIDENGSSIGKTVYEYDNGQYVNSGFPIPPINYSSGGSSYVSTQNYINSTAWQAGFLTSKTVLNSIGETVSKTTIGYSTYNQQTVHIGYIAEFMRTDLLQTDCGTPPCPDPALAWTQIMQTTGARRETSRSEGTYAPDGVTFFATNTATDFHATGLQPVKMTVQKSGSGYNVVELRYPFDFSTNQSSSGPAGSIHKLIQQNAMSTPIEKFSYVENGGSKTLTSAQLTTFKLNENNAAHVVPDRMLFLESTAVIPVGTGGFIPSSININNVDVAKDLRYKERVCISAYDALSNPEVMAKVKDIPTSFVYGYNKKRAIAEITNAQNVTALVSAMVPGPVSENIAVYGSTSNTIQVSKTFTTSTLGTVTLRFGVPGNPSYATVATWTGITSASATLQKGNCGLNTITFSNVAANTYTLIVTLTTPDSNVASLGACGQLEYPGMVAGTVDQGVKEVLIVNFEEMTGENIQENTLLAHSGRKYWDANYLVSFTPPANGRQYKIEYWNMNNGQWKWISLPYTGPGMLLNHGNTPIDDIRIYPSDAQMKSYTHDLLNGITSVISENGQTLLYDYDSFGRLWRIRNDKGTVEKIYEYNYKGK